MTPRTYEYSWDYILLRNVKDSTPQISIPHVNSLIINAMDDHIYCNACVSVILQTIITVLLWHTHVISIREFQVPSRKTFSTWATVFLLSSILQSDTGSNMTDNATNNTHNTSYLRVSYRTDFKVYPVCS